MSVITENSKATEEKKAYRKPTLQDFGNLRYATKTDPNASSGQDLFPEIEAWGDPS